MEYNEFKEKLVTELKRKSEIKTKFYFNQLSEILGLKPRQSKEIINKMVEDGTLEFWSSGSTTMYGLTGIGKQHLTENE